MVTFPTMIGGGPIEAFPLEQDVGWEAIIDDYDCGAIGSRRRWSKYRRLMRLVTNPLQKADVHRFFGFLNDYQAEEWEKADLCVNVFDPFIAPVLTETGGGALAGRTYYVKFTWSDGTNETLPSEQATKVVSANNWIEVTVPQFPAGVTRANIYIGTVDGVETYVGYTTTSGGTWTEFSTAVDVNSASGQKVLSIAATTGFLTEEMITTDKGGGGDGEETGTIDTVQAGVSVTMEDNLLFTHLALSADVVQHAVDGGSALPTENTLEYSPTFVLLGDPKLRRAGPNHWRTVLIIGEVF